MKKMRSKSRATEKQETLAGELAHIRVGIIKGFEQIARGELAEGSGE